MEYEQGRDVVPDNCCEIPNRDNSMDVGFWHQQEKNRLCFEMVTEHERQMGWKYDYVVKMRADLNVRLLPSPNQPLRLCSLVCAPSPVPPSSNNKLSATGVSCPQVNDFGVKATDLDPQHIFSYDQCNVMASVGNFPVGPLCDMAYVVPRSMADVAFSAVKVLSTSSTSPLAPSCPHLARIGLPCDDGGASGGTVWRSRGARAASRTATRRRATYSAGRRPEALPASVCSLRGWWRTVSNLKRRLYAGSRTLPSCWT